MYSVISRLSADGATAGATGLHSHPLYRLAHILSAESSQPVFLSLYRFFLLPFTPLHRLLLLGQSQPFGPRKGDCRDVANRHRCQSDPAAQGTRPFTRKVGSLRRYCRKHPTQDRMRQIESYIGNFTGRRSGFGHNRRSTHSLTVSGDPSLLYYDETASHQVTKSALHEPLGSIVKQIPPVPQDAAGVADAAAPGLQAGGGADVQDAVRLKQAPIFPHDGLLNIVLTRGIKSS